MHSSQEQTEDNLQSDVRALSQIISQMGWITHRQQTQRLKAFNLTVPQFMTMRAIRQYGRACTMSEIAEAALQIAATVTGIIDRLESSDLVERHSNPADRRSFRVSLTAHGTALLDRIDQQKQRYLQQYLSSLSPEKRRDLLAIMNDYLRAMMVELEAP